MTHLGDEVPHVRFARLAEAVHAADALAHRADALYDVEEDDVLRGDEGEARGYPRQA